MQAGEIVYKGKAVRLTSPRAALALGVSTVYQEFNFCPDLNVLENLYIGRSLPTNALGLVDWTDGAETGQGRAGQFGCEDRSERPDA